MANSKTEIMEVFSQLSPENQRTVLLCARTAKVAEGAVMSGALGSFRNMRKGKATFCNSNVI